MNGTKRRGWLAALLAFFLLLLVVWVVAVFQLSPAAAGGGQLGVALRSGLAADYGSEPIRRIVRSLRISVVADLMRDLGMSDAEAGEAMHAMKVAMSSPVPTATARNFDGDDPFTATPSRTPLPTETPLPTATRTHRPPTRTPEPTETERPRHHPSRTPTPDGGEVEDVPPEILDVEMDPGPGDVGGCHVDLEISVDVYDPVASEEPEVKVYYYWSGHTPDHVYLDTLPLCSGHFNPDGSWEGCAQGVVDFTIEDGWSGEEEGGENPGPDDFEIEFKVKAWDGVLDEYDLFVSDPYFFPAECDDPD